MVPQLSRGTALLSGLQDQCWKVDIEWDNGKRDQNHRVLAAIHVFRCRKAHFHTLPPNLRALPRFEANDGEASLYRSLDSLRKYRNTLNVFIDIVFSPILRSGSRFGY